MASESAVGWAKARSAVPTGDSAVGTLRFAHPTDPLSRAMTTDGMIDLRDVSHAVEAYLDGRAALDGLIDHAVALGELEELVELLLLGVGVDRKGEPDLRKADRRVLGDAEGAAEIEVALGRYGAGLERDRERGRDRLERHARAGNERLEQHVAGAQLEPGAAGRRMQARDRERTTRLDLAGDVGVVERALGAQRDVGGLGIGLVTLLDRRLHRAQFGGIH